LARHRLARPIPAARVVNIEPTAATLALYEGVWSPRRFGFRVDHRHAGDRSRRRIVLSERPAARADARVPAAYFKERDSS